MIYQRKTGVTIPINCIVSNVADLSGAKCLFGIKNQFGVQVLQKTPVVNLNVLSVVLESEETMAAGAYKFEFRIKIDEYVESVYTGNLLLVNSVLKGVE